MSTGNNFPFPGLAPKEVEESRAKYGANVLTPPKREPWWRLFLEKFDDPVIRILIIAAVIAIGVGILDGKYVEGLGIMLAILLATTLAFLNEYEANKEFDVLNQVNDEVPVKVVRSGNLTTIPKKDLVVGDVVLVELGEEIPADGEVLDAVSLQIGEAKLTGESMPVYKSVNPMEHHLHEGHEAAYPSNHLCRGTIVAEGHGVMRVTGVGDHTEIGKTARAAAEETGAKTPLNIQLERLSKVIGVVGFAVALALFLALVVRGVVKDEIHLVASQWYFSGSLAVGTIVFLIPLWIPILYDAFELLRFQTEMPRWVEADGLGKWLKSLIAGGLTLGIGVAIGSQCGWMSWDPHTWIPMDVAKEFLKYFMIAVTIIVVAVPEGLAMSVTLSLAYSMKRMIATNVLVRQMHACETIGASTVICTDKTGTLTLNEMRVQEIVFPCLTSKTLSREKQSENENLILDAICANSGAHLSTETTGDRYLGNPTEGALLLWLKDQGFDYLHYRSAFKIEKQWPFTTDKKYMATFGSSSRKQSLCHIKGAPEIVLASCSTLLTSKGIQPLADKSSIEEALKSFQKRGMRTLGFAYRQIDSAPADDMVMQNLTWIGFAAIADTIRPEIPDVIKACKRADIMVKIVTGDNPTTAQEIARQIGMWDEKDPADRYVTGPEFMAMSEEKAAQAALNLKVLSRARPMDKMKLVSLLKGQNQVVAVTGDGVNDAPALNYADVGLAMGKTGTSVAKEASDIVILDDSFTSVVNAVMWGRSLYQNIQKFILFQLTINVAALGIALLGPFIGVKLPFTVTQMLWINLIMDTFAALALSTEPPKKSVMDRPPRNPQSFIITKSMAWNIFGVASLYILFLGAVLIYIQKDHNISDYELSVFFTIFVMLQFWNLFNAKCLEQNESAFSNISQNKSFLIIASAIIIGQIFIVQFGGNVFRTAPMPWQTWLWIIAGTSAILWIGELKRLIGRIRHGL